MPLAGSRSRALLAVLALAAGHAVSVETLAMRVWGERAPDRVRAALQTHIWRLRAVLGSDLVRFDPTGYRLTLDRHRIDALAFADRCAAARATDDPRRERTLLQEAVALWSGEPFGEDLSAWLTHSAAPQLVDSYLRAVERRVDLDLAAGDTDGIVAELRALTDTHPLRESLWLRLLRSLRVEGRTAEALAAYGELRVRLADELGADPAPELQALHLDLLRGTAPAATPARVPRTLPADLPHFVGRDAELAALDALVCRDDVPGSGARLAVVHGPAGSGKTSLLVHWGHRVTEAFPDGQLFLHLRGFDRDPPVPAHTALDLLLRAVGVPGNRIPDAVEARSALLRTELADRRMLLVLDDAHDAGQVRPLLPSGPSLVVVTSRNELRSLAVIDGAARVAVGPMTPDDAVRLIRRRTDAAQPGPGTTPTTSESLLASLAEHCGHLPLALAIAGERAGRAPDLDAFVTELADRRRRLDALGSSEDPLTDLRSLFDASYRYLDPDATRALRVIGLYPEGVVSTGAVSALAGLDRQAADRAMDRLTESNLLRLVRAGTFAIHDLLRLYAIELVHREDGPVERAAARDRLHSWFAHSAEAACLRLWRYPTAIEAGPLAAGTEPEAFGTENDAIAWFAGHRSALTAVIDQAFEADDHRTVCRLVPRLGWYLILIGAGDDQLRLCRLALASARTLGDPQHIGGAANNLGIAWAQQGEDHNDDARRCFDEAAEAYTRSGDLDGLHRTKNNIGALLCRTDTPGGVAYLEELLAEMRQLHVPALDTCGTLRNLTANHCRLGNYDRAMDLAQELLDVARSERHALHEAGGLDALGTAQLARGDAEAACRSFREAVELYHHAGDRLNEANQLREVGKAELTAGRPEAARAAWTESLDLLEEIRATGRSTSVDQVRALLEELADQPDPPVPAGPGPR
ncbi:AfsR/SARP family transcriptional regulator [Georgenia alba]|uniref:BTAD domain-containing putative transcriptional regulator n=1 Tax=Georgenia alba TaxID=2233858 RepID=A0ABW2Q3P3_9MICO